MSGLHPPHQPEFFEHLELIGDVLVPGRLYEVNDKNSYRYPGLTLAVEPESRILHPSKRTSRSAERLAERKEAATKATAISLQAVTGANAWEIADWAGTSEHMISSVYRHRLRRVSGLCSIDSRPTNGKAQI